MHVNKEPSKIWVWAPGIKDAKESAKTEISAAVSILLLFAQSTKVGGSFPSLGSYGQFVFTYPVLSLCRFAVCQCQNLQRRCRRSWWRQSVAQTPLFSVSLSSISLSPI